MSLLQALYGTVTGVRGDATVKLEGIIPDRKKARIEKISLRAVVQTRPVIYDLDVRLKSGEHIHIDDRCLGAMREKFSHPDDIDKIFDAQFRWCDSFPSDR